MKSSTNLGRFVLAFMIMVPAWLAGSAFATFLPPNNLHLQDNFSFANMSEKQFNEVIDAAQEFYTPIIAAHGGTLSIKRNWTDSTVNAYAQKIGTTWQVAMFGGLARRPEVTLDGFALVVCHELGHHLGGFPYSSPWAANEGQSDYFATLACGKRLWIDQIDENAKHRLSVEPFPKATCDKVYASEEDQNLCYRQMAAGYSLGDLLGSLGGDPKIKYDTPDNSKVSSTVNSHPRAQCRLDTYMAGALCIADWDDSRIPKNEKESNEVTCNAQLGFEEGARPKCWYKSAN